MHRAFIGRPHDVYADILHVTLDQGEVERHRGRVSSGAARRRIEALRFRRRSRVPARSRRDGAADERIDAPQRPVGIDHRGGRLLGPSHEVTFDSGGPLPSIGRKASSDSRIGRRGKSCASSSRSVAPAVLRSDSAPGRPMGAAVWRHRESTLAHTTAASRRHSTAAPRLAASRARSWQLPPAAARPRHGRVSARHIHRWSRAPSGRRRCRLPTTA